jgi:diguanylate cyclase (GGDEF)-like protein
VVEDDSVARRVVQALLRDLGHDVEACADGETAWEQAQAREFDLAVLDMNLPGIDGAELCRRLRKLPNGEDMVIVFLTGSEDPTNLRSALDAGADDYILKPVTDPRTHVRLGMAERTVYLRREQRRTEEALRENALRDTVTDLGNRTLFMERLHQTARRASRENVKGTRQSTYLYAVLYLNLDAFAGVNTDIGFEGGNLALREVGRRLEECVRGVDTVARFQGDEFLILLDDMNDVSDPTRVAQRIEQALARPVEVDGQEVRMSAAIGIALNVGGPDDPAKMVEDAQRALSRAKIVGPGSYEIFDAVVHARAAARLSMESQLRDAVRQGHMSLFYQPIVEMDSGQTVGFEALSRWIDPQRGIIMPAEFMDVAEVSGVIDEMGKWAIDEALRQLGLWQSELSRPDLFVSVNLSARQFNLPSSVDRIVMALEESGLPQGSLHIEITETALMRDLDGTARALQILRDASIKLHADDFGTGYSSLGYLARLPLDSLKIDRSFVSALTHSPENLEVVRTISRLAQNLGLSVIAEGIETERQLEELRKLECQYGQGFLFGRPTPPPDVPELLVRPDRVIEA